MDPWGMCPSRTLQPDTVPVRVRLRLVKQSLPQDMNWMFLPVECVASQSPDMSGRSFVFHTSDMRLLATFPDLITSQCSFLAVRLGITCPLINDFSECSMRVDIGVSLMRCSKRASHHRNRARLEWLQCRDAEGVGSNGHDMKVTREKSCPHCRHMQWKTRALNWVCEFCMSIMPD
jgi:hypothetical protein